MMNDYDYHDLGDNDDLDHNNDGQDNDEDE